jgi:hypothetical protein
VFRDTEARHPGARYAIFPAIMTNEIEKLLRRVEAATGRDRDIDRDVARLVARITAQDEAPEYTASVDQCIALIDHALPGWHWHVGYGADGVFPYASLRHGRVNFETRASTVPLALLTAAVKARLSQSPD